MTRVNGPTSHDCVVGSALAQIRRQRLYRDTHGAFEVYCRERWAMSRIQAHRLIGASQIVEMLPVGNKPTSERQVRPLTGIKDPDEQRQVWGRALEVAQEEGVPVSSRQGGGERWAVTEIARAVKHNGGAESLGLGLPDLWDRGIRARDNRYWTGGQMVYSWGYKGKKLSDLLALLDERDAILIDCRFKPWTRYAGFHQGTLRKRLGDCYHWIRGFGNLNWNKDMTAPVLIADLEGGWQQLQEIMELHPGKNLILMCTCRVGEDCHRHEVAEWLLANHDLEYEHLVQT